MFYARACFRRTAEVLFVALMTVFNLSDNEFTVASTMFWLISGGPAVIHETSMFGGASRDLAESERHDASLCVPCVSLCVSLCVLLQHPAIEFEML